ncbi:MAG: hypothetical protein J6583_07910, partial [Gilliamella sp.]|nr:hypothetical protein [Gilliamella sp.]
MSNYSAHRVPHPFGPTLHVVQICSRKICRTLSFSSLFLLNIRLIGLIQKLFNKMVGRERLFGTSCASPLRANTACCSNLFQKNL